MSCGIIYWYNDEPGEKFFVFNYRTEIFSGGLLDKTEEGSVFWIDKDDLEKQPLTEGMWERLPMFFENDNLKLFIDWLNRKRIHRCEACSTELSIYSYSSDDSQILYCIVCSEYYFRSSHNSPIFKYEVPEGLLKMWKMDPYHSYYTGIPISEAYEPKWIKLLRRLF